MLQLRYEAIFSWSPTSFRLAVKAECPGTKSGWGFPGESSRLPPVRNDTFGGILCPRIERMSSVEGS